MYILIIVIILAALFGIGILVSRSKQKPPSESAEAQDIEWRISAAKSRALEAESRLAEWRILAARNRFLNSEARATAKKGMIERIWEPIRENPKLWGFGLYGWSSLLGMSYSWSFYNEFDIDIFRFADPTDFLLFALSEVILFAILIIIVPSIIFAFLLPLLLASKASAWVAKGIKGVYEFVKPFALDVFGVALLLITLPSILPDQLNAVVPTIPLTLSVFFLLLVLLLCFSKVSAWVAKGIKGVYEFVKLSAPYASWLLIFILTIYFSHILGHLRGQDMLQGARQDRGKQWISKVVALSEQMGGRLLSYTTEKVPTNERQLVRVTLRQEAAQPTTRPPGSLLFLGTTSSFHFFYECENDMVAKVVRPHRLIVLPPFVLVRWARPKCVNGRPFIIPTANIASLEFKPKEDLPPHVVLSVSIESIADLKRITQEA